MFAIVCSLMTTNNNITDFTIANFICGILWISWEAEEDFS